MSEEELQRFIESFEAHTKAILSSSELIQKYLVTVRRYNEDGMLNEKHR